MACNVAPGKLDQWGTGNNIGDNVGCQGGCFDLSDGSKDTNTDIMINKDAVKDTWGDEPVGCANGCHADCCQCADQCGNECYGSCQSCTGNCVSTCGFSCGGGCADSCTGCTGNCSGSCSGGCQNACNSGCTSQEQQDNANVGLDRIINVENVKKIFRFIMGEAKRRGISLNSGLLKNVTPAKSIDDVTDEVEMLSILYYTMPLLFENSLKSLGKTVDTQSGVAPLISAEGGYTSGSNHGKWYASITAKQWIQKATELYNQTLPVG